MVELDPRSLLLQAPEVKLCSTRRDEEAMDYDDDDNHEDDNANRNQSGNQSRNQSSDTVELRSTPKPRRRPHGIHE